MQLMMDLNEVEVVVDRMWRMPMIVDDVLVGGWMDSVKERERAGNM